ncbi:MAG: tetratricopeptide repeat protein [Ignavibacterium sp.]|nr:MAG: tetratricopeptide repeat protein [Ignavibacterium sp.]
MIKEIRLILILIFLIGIVTNITHSQSLRGLVNDGVDQYKEGNYSDAEVKFKKGTDKAPDSFEAQFNLGDAYFKQQRYDEAIKSYKSSLAMSRNDIEKSKVHYNVGNSLLKSQKIEESIEEYKKSLKLNPIDQEAKYNLSYALEMLKNQQQQDQQQDKKDKEKKDEEKKDEQKDKKEEKKEDQQQKQDQQKQDQKKKEDQKQQQQPQPQKISKEEAERILEALKDNEKDLQKELRRVKGKRVKTDKDW